MVDGLHASPRDRGVSWLPLYHDMGLIGFVLSPLVTRTPITFISTLDFLKDPEVWVRTLSEDRGTISFAPNFGYALTARRTKSTDGLDLSAVRVLGCGAEPIQPDAIDGFFERFAETDLKRRAFLACYGLAETTLAVTFAGLEDELKLEQLEFGCERTDEGTSGVHRLEHRIPVVSCGRPLPRHRVSILGEHSEPLTEHRVGEVFVEGPSVTDGYWDDEEATNRVFFDGGVKTGDLGYMSKGELYVTGRLKDTNIVRAVQRDVGLTVSEVVLIEAGSLPKTTSGKLQRGATREQYLDGTLGGVRRRTDGLAVA